MRPGSDLRNNFGVTITGQLSELVQRVATENGWTPQEATRRILRDWFSLEPSVPRPATTSGGAR